MQILNDRVVYVPISRDLFAGSAGSACVFWEAQTSSLYTSVLLQMRRFILRQHRRFTRYSCGLFS